MSKTQFIKELKEILSKISQIAVPSFVSEHRWTPGDMFSDYYIISSCSIYLQNEYKANLKLGKLEFVKRQVDFHDLETLVKFAAALNVYSENFKKEIASYKEYGMIDQYHYSKEVVQQDYKGVISILEPLFAQYQQKLNEYLAYLAEKSSMRPIEDNLQVLEQSKNQNALTKQVRQQILSLLQKSHAGAMQSYHKKLESHLAKGMLEEI